MLVWAFLAIGFGCFAIGFITAVLALAAKEEDDHVLPY